MARCNRRENISADDEDRRIAATMGERKMTDPRRVALARLNWGHATASQDWIAEQLGISSAANMGQLLKRTAKAPSAAELQRAFAAGFNRGRVEPAVARWPPHRAGRARFRHPVPPVEVLLRVV